MSKKTTPIVRRLFWLTVLTAAVGFGVQIFLTKPLYDHLSSNVLYQDAWWMEILYFLTPATRLIDLVVAAICFPATLYAIRRADRIKSVVSIPIVFSAITLVKYMANFVVVSLMAGALPDGEDLLTLYLPMILLEFGYEIIVYLLVVGVAFLVRWLYHARIETAEGIKLLPRNQRCDYPLPPPDFPFVQMYARRNALQRGALLTALLVMARQVLDSIAWVTADNVDYGIGMTVVEFIDDIFVGLIFYFVALLLMMRFYRTETRLNQKKAD